MEKNLIDAGQVTYPQPVAVACGNITRAENQLDATLRAGEILCRYIAVCVLASFRSRSSGDIPKQFQNFNNNLSWGHFLDLISSVASQRIEHPLKTYLDGQFDRQSKTKDKKNAAAIMSELIQLRNQISHSLGSSNSAFLEAFIEENQPLEKLNTILYKLKSFLELPLFFVGNQGYAVGKFTPTIYFFMGESMPSAETFELDNEFKFENTQRLYLGLYDGVLDLHPLILRELDEARKDYTLFVPHKLFKNKVVFRSIQDTDKELFDEYASGWQAALSGNREDQEKAMVAKNHSFQQYWQTKKQILVTRLESDSSRIPWEKLEETTLSWYADRLNIQEPHLAITENLLEQRQVISVEEHDQLILLFGQKKAVSDLIGRDTIDCRYLENDPKPNLRWNERLEDSKNLLGTLRTVVDFITEKLLSINTTVESLNKTEGSADYLAIREALINLLIHQDYEKGGPVAQITLKPEIAIFFNSGYSLVGEEALMIGYRSHPRNPLISRAFKLIGFSEMAGTGLVELRKVWSNEKRPLPKLESDRQANTFTITLDWRTTGEHFDLDWKRRLGVDLDEYQARALNQIVDENEREVHQIASNLGLPVDEVEAILEFLQFQSLIQKKDNHFVPMQHVSDLFSSERED